MLRPLLFSNGRDFARGGAARHPSASRKAALLKNMLCLL